MKKFALVLSGGGFKGAFQIGALRHLKQNWSVLNPDDPAMKFNIIAGVSVGSLNGVLTACDEFDQLEKLWLDIANNVEEIYTSDFIDTKNQTDELKFRVDFRKLMKRLRIDLNISLSQAFQFLFRRERFVDAFLQNLEMQFNANFKTFRSIADNTPLKRKLESLVSIDKVKDCIYKCGFVSLNDGKYYGYKHTDFKSDTDFQNAILASTAMPIVWEPVPEISVKNQTETINQSVDGGIMNVSPLADVIEEINKDDPMHEYVVIIINCNSGQVRDDEYKNSNIAGIALRSLNEIAITEIFNNDITEFARINDLIHQVRASHPTMNLFNFNLKEGRTDQILRPFKTIIIQTDTDVLGDPLIANQNLNNKRILHGEQKAALALSKFKHSNASTDMIYV